MTKWFDTNYHYRVPELGPDTVFTADSTQQVAELGQALGVTPRPVLVGLVTYLLLAKPAPGVAADFDPLTLLDRRPVYAQVLTGLRTAGAEWVQLDEPALVQDRTPAELNAAARAYRDLGGLTDRPKLLVASYFDRLGDALPCSPRLRWRAWRSTSPRPPPPTWTRSPPWADCPAGAWSPVSSTGATSGSTTWRSPSPPSTPSSRASGAVPTPSRPNSPFPQTTELRTARADLRAGRIDSAGYEERIRAEIGEVISFQEKTGLDVLVHGEAERNDRVQYFAEQLTGYLATRYGWVQSYGTRYVRPPILAGDISRPEAMTVRGEWMSYTPGPASRG